MNIQAIDDFMFEMEYYEYSPAGFDEYKLSQEIYVLNEYINNVTYLDRNEHLYESSEYLDGYFMECDASVLMEAREQLAKKNQNFFQKIGSTILGWFRKLLSIFSSKPNIPDASKHRGDLGDLIYGIIENGEQFANDHGDLVKRLNSVFFVGAGYNTLKSKNKFKAAFKEHSKLPMTRTIEVNAKASDGSYSKEYYTCIAYQQIPDVVELILGMMQSKDKNESNDFISQLSMMCPAKTPDGVLKKTKMAISDKFSHIKPVASELPIPATMDQKSYKEYRSAINRAENKVNELQKVIKKGDVSKNPSTSIIEPWRTLVVKSINEYTHRISEVDKCFFELSMNQALLKASGATAITMKVLGVFNKSSKSRDKSFLKSQKKNRRRSEKEAKLDHDETVRDLKRNKKYSKYDD